MTKHQQLNRIAAILLIVSGCDDLHHSGQPPAVTDSQVATHPTSPGSTETRFSDVDSSRPLSISDVLAVLEEAGAVADLSADHNTPWELVHAVIGIGGNAYITRDGARVSLFDYFFRFGQYGGVGIYEVANGNVRVRRGSVSRALELHPDQFLAYFAMAGVSQEQPLMIDGVREYTISDCIAACKEDSPRHGSNSYALIALATYVPWTASWNNRYGRVVAVKDVLSRELEENQRYLPCGGTHRLFAIATALRRYQSEIRSDDPIWARAHDVVELKLAAARGAQLPDGSFHPQLIGLSEDGSWRRHVYTAGHSLEWIVQAVPDSDLTAKWIVDAVKYLSKMIEAHKHESCDAGEWFHALHALRLYIQRLSE